MIKLKFSLFILLSFVSIITLDAQNARAILDKASEAYTKAGAITASFALETKDMKSKNTYSYDGKAYLKGNKFKMEIPDGITWFDGVTQWVYMKENQEVSVSNPTNEELQMISPSALFGMYKQGFNLTYKGEKSIKGAAVVEIEMVPQKKNPSIAKVIMQINKATSIFSSITVVDKSNLQTTLSITKLQTGANVPDATFVFNKKEYPKVDVIDLR